jgi:hypothetical protein
MALVVIAQEPANALAVRIVRPLVGARATAVPAIAEAGPAAAPDYWHVFVGTALLALGAAIGVYLLDKGLYAFKPNPGISMFAIFYVFAQALERITELVSLVVPDAGGTRSSLGAGRIAKRSAIEARDSRLARALSAPDAQSVSDAARAQGDLDRIRLNRAVLGWTFTSALAMAGAGLLGLRLIDTISSTSNAAPVWVDLVVTGLVIGGATKPLHDLIAGLQDSRKARQDSPAAGGR